MAAAGAKTGKAGNLTISTTVIPITKASPSVSVDFADSTDSSNYDAATQNLYKAQLGSAIQAELSIEGYWDPATTPSAVTAKLQNTSGGPYAMVVKLDGSTTFISGNFDITNVNLDLTIGPANMIGFTATAKSNGKFTLN